MTKKSLFDSDSDDSNIIDHSGYAYSVGHGVIDFDTGSFARGGGRPGGGGTGGGGTGGTTSTYISGDPNVPDSNEYNIKILFQGTWDPVLKQDFIDCANQISKYITGDVPNVSLFGTPVDDIQIKASLVSIDGVGGILGQAGPEYVRVGSYLPVSATMQFDVADANTYQSLGLFDDIVMHEMLHSVGFGSIWQNKGLIAGAGTATPTFIGAQATAAYDAAGGIGSPRVEDGGGSGTALSHWDEQTFTNELMTGYINNPNYLSYMTVASLGDLGYSVVDSGGFTPPTFI